MSIDFNANSVNINNDSFDLDPRNVMRVSNCMQKRKSFGKAWDIGDQGTVFVPFKWYKDPTMPVGGTFEPHIGACFGHEAANIKDFGTTFIPSLARIGTDGQVVGEGDLAFQFSKIAPLLVRAEKEHALADLNKKDWSILGTSAYQTARAEVEKQYNTKENMNAKKPALGRLRVRKMTEVVYIAMDPNSGTPIFDNDRNQKTGVYVQDLSDARLGKLRTLANDVNVGIIAQHPGLVPEENTLYFLEVVYNFTSAKNNRSEAGRADPQGVAQSITILARNPQLEGKLNELLKQVPASTTEIKGHAYGTQKVDENVLKQKLQTILFNSCEYFKDMMEEDKALLVKNAKILDYLRIAPNNDPDLNARLTEELGHPIGQAPADTKAPTIENILKDNAPDFSLQQEDVTKITDNMSSDSMDDLPFEVGI